ncbi:MAG: flagellar basal body rod protein FlgC [Clostridia bacterium]|nr:flagellar basal body rod protein FlgC [Clostridia bacterium]
MSIFNTFGVNASGMTAERFRMDIISQNVANANTTRTADGTPYRRKIVTFTEKEDTREAFGQVFSRVNGGGERTGDGVKVSGVYEDETTDLIKAYDPSHPDADADGYVWYPNVNIVTEMTNMIDSSRAYEANATAFTASKTIAMKGLEIGNGQ